MNAFDHALVPTLVLLLPIVDRVWLYPSLVRATRAEVPGARSRFYALGTLVEWAFAGSVLALWVADARPWSALRLGTPEPWRLATGLLLSALYGGLAWSTRRRLLAHPERLARMAKHLSSAAALLPRTAAERRSFAVLSVTAGICEEILFRGYLPGYLGAWASPLVAVLASSVLFGFAHAYLGFPHVVRTSIVGALLAGLVALSGSLVPAMIVHAAMDLVSGDVGPRALELDAASASA